MPTATNTQKIAGLYSAFFNRAPDLNGLTDWEAQFAADEATIFDIAAGFAENPMFDATYGAMSDEEFVEAIYVNVLGAAGDADGIAYWVEYLADTNNSRADMVAQFVSDSLEYDADAALENGEISQEVYDAAVERQAFITNKAEVGIYFAQTLGADSDVTNPNYLEDQAYLASIEVLANVDASADSVAAAKALIDEAVASGNPAAFILGEEPTTPVVPGQTFLLTTNQDVAGVNLGNTDGDDTFKAMIFDNQNTFQSGDIIDGGAGRDTLDITLGNSSNFAVLAETQNVEVVSVRSQAVNTAGNTGDNEVGESDIISGARNVIDAELMSGVEEWWSSNSRADLIVEDVRSNSHETTVGFRNADAGDVDYAVYFDNQFITAADPFNEGASLFLRLLDLDGMRTDGQPLLNNPYDGFSFTLDGDRKSIQSEAILNATSFAELRDAINAALAADPELAGLEASLGTVYNAINSDTGVSYSGTEIVISNTGSGALGTGSWLTPTGEAPADTNILARQSDVQPETIEPITSVNIVLDNVGRGSKAGDLEIGAMSQSDYSESRGIQQFDIEVDRNSWIDTLQSTNNTLEVVNVENIGANGSVRIDELNDVRVFDASAMLGDVTLNADLSGAVVGKYMQLEDSQANPAEDNVAFNYSTGAGNDSITLDISSANLANDTFVGNVGTTTREDFDLNISTGEGDDYVKLTIVNGAGNAADADDGDANWYQNSSLNSNLQINTGDGNDTIWTPGSGNVAINAGAGDDTIYVDNTGEYGITGRKATFVFNQNNTSLTDPQSDTVETYRVFNGTLTVTFKGYEVEVALPHTNGVVSDLQVNQAIKDAINGNDVLNKLLVAKDSAANGLVVESLIDGVMTLDDLSVELSAPTSLTPAEVAQLNQFYNQTGLTDTQLLALMNNDITAFETRGDYDTTFARLGSTDYAGVDSTHTSDNTIIAGAGDDVVVLGTGAFSNDTVVYEGWNNGFDTIVNFDTDLNPQTVTTPSVNVTETVTITFSDFDGSDPSSIVFDGSTVDLAFTGDNQGLIPAEDVAYQFVDQYTTAGWIATLVPGTGTVTLVSTAAGDQTDLTAGDFTLVGGTVSIDEIVQGSVAYVPGTNEVFTVDFTGSIVTQDGNFTFDGVTINYTTGDGEITLADKVASASFSNWTVADNFDGTVTFTANAFGDVTDTDYTTEFAPADGITTIVAKVADGTDATGTQTTQIVNGAESLDFLDFSDYGVEAVYVNGVLTAQNTTATEQYVQMTEAADNAGEYLIELFDFGEDGVFGGADDNLIGVIGTADFGTDVQGNGFVTENFII